MARTLLDIVTCVEASDTGSLRRRDLVSAVRRVGKMAGVSLAHTVIDVPRLRSLLSGLRPAQHGMSQKTWANLRSCFAAALELAGEVDPMNRGAALAHPLWRRLLEA